MSFIGIADNLWSQQNGSVAPGDVLSVAGVAATLDINFVANTAFVRPTGETSIAALLTCTRASDGYYQNAAGVLSNGFGNNVLRTGTNGLLVEESRTNLILQSNTFGVTWILTNLTNVTTTTTGPDNVAASATLTNETVTNSNHGVSQGINKAASNLAYTISGYMKQGVGRTRVRYFLNDEAGNGVTATFDLAGGQIGVAATLNGAGFSAQSATITQLGTTGWYFCTVTGTSNTATRINFEIDNDNGSGTGASSISYAGTVGNGIYIFGLQLEQASFATSYIPTTTVAVTRAADHVTTTTVAFLTQGIGTLYAQGTVCSGATNANQFAGCGHNDGTSNNSVDIRIFNLSFNTIGVTASATIFNISATTTTAGSTVKWAAAYQNSAQSVAGNGGAPSSNATGTIETVSTTFEIGSTDVFQVPWNSYLKRVAYFNTKLSNANLQTLTT